MAASSPHRLPRCSTWYHPTDEIQLPPDEPVLSAAAQADAELVMWARQHLFERVFQEAKAEREHVAAIQEDFLKRSFNSLLAQADAAIIAAEEEIDRGVQGAEGRLRKAELVKEQHAAAPPPAPGGNASGAGTSCAATSP